MTNTRIKDENYYQISGWMINRLKLKGVALSAYAIIYGFTQDGENEFTGSLQYLCDFVGGVSKPTIIKALKELVDRGYIFKREEFINGVQFNRYKVNLQVVNNFNWGSKETLQDAVNNLAGGSKETLHNNNINNKSFNNDIYNNIILYLNEKANTKFKATSKATQKHIHARITEGFTEDDFKTVIDKKTADWIGTDFEQYLRPATLFGTKFESYLNAPVSKAKNTYGKTETVEINGVQYIKKNGQYFIPNGSGVAVDPYAENDLAGIL